MATIVKATIGLETHIQLKTESKLFCECPTNYLDAEPNTNICPICVGQPGSKPMAVNEKALRNVIKIALALNCKLNKKILVQRKNYFYPDLPSGYQRTSKPIGVEGKLGEIRIREVHIEEDPGRYELRRGLVDYNRSGIPLIEIVTEPDFDSPEAAKKFLEELAAIMDYLNAGRDEPGSSRIDANISISGGERVEVKNINSFKGVYTALSYEIIRQQNQLRLGKKIERETRHYDEAGGITFPLRKKEMEEDYRYFPDPDVLPIVITKAMIEKAGEEIPELPRAKAERFAKDYNIRGEDAWILVGEIGIANLFEELSKRFDAQKIALWIRGPVKKQLNYRGISFKESGLSTDHLSILFDMFQKKEITDKGMEKIMIALFKEKKDPKQIAKEMDLLKLTDIAEIEKIVDTILKENEKAISDYKAGEEKALNFVVGQVVKKTGGKADSKTVKDLILKKIKK